MHCVSTNRNHGIIPIVLRDIDLGAIALELELGQLTAFAKANNGTVDDRTPLLGARRAKTMSKEFLKFFIY